MRDYESHIGDPGFDYKKAYANAKAAEKKLAADVATVSDYAFTNEIEDKAETGKVLAYPQILGTQMDPSRPILRAKTELLLARLYEKSPQIVKWLAAASRIPGPIGGK
jgi:BioD-like phosphotransacetylase family protein